MLASEGDVEGNRESDDGKWSGGTWMGVLAHEYDVGGGH